MNSYSKEQQLNGWKSVPKEKKPIRNVSSTKKFTCSDGTKVSQSQINARLAKIPSKNGFDKDHTISQQRCKQLHKTELIWDIENIEYSTRQIHEEWERYHSGIFEEHKNVIKRMRYVKKHDPEMFKKRLDRISNYKILKALQ